MHILILIHKCTYTHIHANTRTYTHIHALTRTCSHLHTHAQEQLKKKKKSQDFRIARKNMAKCQLGNDRNDSPVKYSNH